MDKKLLDLLKRSAAIPSMPQVAARFLEIVQDPEFRYQDVVEVLSPDPGMTTEILRLANSPLFGVTRQVTSLPQALALLGLKRVRSLVLGRYIVDSIDKKKLTLIDASYYWRRSLVTAVLAARLAEPIEPKLREEAFTAGLLADIGIVILDEAVPEQFQPVAREYRPHGRPNLLALELEALSASHGEVSAVALEQWRLPDVVCDAVRWHASDLSESKDGRYHLARIVSTADRIAKYLCESPTAADEVAGNCTKILAEIDLEPDVLALILNEIEPQIAEFASILRIDMIPSQIYEMIAQELKASPTVLATAGT